MNKVKPYLESAAEAGLEWTKSSYSGHNGNCVEVAPHDHRIATRDSKNPTGPALLFTPAAWSAFVDAVAAGEFDQV